jgi:hypothetical protein
MKSVFWYVRWHGFYKNRRFGETYRFHHQDGKILLGSVFQLLITADVVPSSLILSIVMRKMILSSETSVLIKATQRHIPQNGILYPLFRFRPSLWSSGQSSCLLTQRSRVRFPSVTTFSE